MSDYAHFLTDVLTCDSDILFKKGGAYPISDEDDNYIFIEITPRKRVDLIAVHKTQIGTTYEYIRKN